MPYRKVQFAQGQFYHIYNRGAGRQPIFQEEENCSFLFRWVKKYARFLLRRDDQIPAGRLPQQVFNSYTKAFNERYDHTGTLFEGPYEAIHDEDQQ